jgi:hypothetical protein
MSTLDAKANVRFDVRGVVLDCPLTIAGIER